MDDRCSNVSLKAGKQGVKVLQVSAHFLPSYRGTEQTVANLSRALRDLGNEVTVLTVNTEGAAEEEVWEGITVCRALSAMSYRRAVVSPALGLKALRAKDFDIYHIHLPFQTGLEMLSLASLVNGVPLVANHHGEGPSVGSVHGVLRAAYNVFYRNIGLSRVDRLIFLTQSYPRSLGFSRRVMRKTVTIPPAIDSRLFHPAANKVELRRELGQDPEAKIILFVSGLSFRDWRRHGDHVIAAAAIVKNRIPGLRVIVVGEGELVPMLSAQARALGLDSAVHFAGKVQGKKLADYYAASDIFVFPSTYESFGFVVIEAMACGLPCIVCDIPGVGELVAHGKNGLKVPSDDVQALATAIGTVFDDADRLRMMSTNARASVESRTWRQVAAETADLYREVVRSHGRKTFSGSR